MPSPWPPIPAGSVSRIEIGGTPARNNPAFWARGGDGHLWVSIADMHEDMIYVTKERITDLGVRSSNVKPVPAGTPLMSFKLTVGRVAIAGADLFTNEAIAAFHVIDDEVSPRWLYHALPGAALKVVTDTAVKGATLNKAKLHELTLELPPPPEQRRIAEILDTLDEAIRRTEQVIAKLQQMKQGLLHDLLTRGIDENGELRDPERHPEQFQDSLLGRIPKGWEVRSISKTFVVLNPGSRQDQRSCTPTGRTPVLDQSETGLMGYADVEPGIQASPIKPVVTFANHTCSVRWVTYPCSAIQNVFFMRAKSHVTDRFLYYLVHGRIPQQAYQGHWPLLQQVSVCLPLMPEQSAIAEILDSFEQQTNTESVYVSKLHTLKHGLMNDLLTGRVRVPVPEEAAS